MKGNSTVISSKNNRIRLERYVTGVLVTRLTFPSIESAVKAYPTLWKGDFINLLPFGTVHQNDWDFLSDDMMCEIESPNRMHYIYLDECVLFTEADWQRIYEYCKQKQYPKQVAFFERDSYGDHLI